MLRSSSWVRVVVAVMIIVLSVFASSSVIAQEPGTIRGRVVDDQDRPVVSATVVLLDTELETTTGVDGGFEFAAVTAGEYRIQAMGDGFAADAAELITVEEGTVTEVVFRLDPVPLKEIVVTSSVSILREEPVATVSLDRKQITELPHFGDDLFRAVMVLPGTNSGDISARFGIRGGLHNETLVRLDDMELFEPYHLKDFQGVFSVFDPEMIGGIDLVPGGFTAEYGDRMTGVLDMSSRMPTETHGSIGISFSNAWANTGGTFADGKGRWLGSLRRGYLDLILGIVGAQDPEESNDDPPSPTYWDAFGLIGYDPGPRNSLSLQLLLADDDLLFEDTDPNDFVDVTTGYGSSYLWLRHQGVVSGSSFVNSNLYVGRITVRRDMLAIDEPERFELDDDRVMDLYGLRQDWQHELGKRNYLRWGFELRTYDVSYDYDNESLIADAINDPRFEPGERVTTYHDSFEGEWYALYLSDRIKLADRFTAEVGARWDRQTLTGNSDISPRANLLINVGSSSLLRFGWGHYQSQRPYELEVQFGEDQFYPAQRAEHFTAGFETDLARSYTLRVDAYRREVSDPQPRWETIFDPFNPVPEASVDVARLAPESATGSGLELYLASRTGGSFDWWMSYAWSSIEDFIVVDTPRFIDQTHAFTASGSWRPGPRWSLTGVWTYHTGWPTTAVTAELVPAPGGGLMLSYDVGPFYQERLDDYHRLDVRASRTTRVGRGHLTFFIDIQNLYNRQNIRGLQIADPDYYWNPDTESYDVVFPETYWLPIIPSFGVSWEF